MAAFVRRPTRIVSIAGAIAIFYILLILIPQQSDNNTYPGLQFVKSTFDWSAQPESHPVASITPLPKGVPRKIPKVQHDFDTSQKPNLTRLAVLDHRRLAVRNAFIKTWSSYKTGAWMQDELAPVSGRPKQTFGGWGATLVDSLDTLWIMDLKEEFYEAAAAVSAIDWTTEERSINIFETTIRHLGGLLSAFDLSQETALLQKAIEIGDMLYAGYDTPNRMPPFWLDFEKAKGGRQVAGAHDASAAVASSGLEFTRLAQLTGQDKYYDAINRISQLLSRTQNTTKLPGMWPVYFNMQSEDLLSGSTFTLGALADSLYEYLPKLYMILGGLEPMYETLYRGAMNATINHLLFRPMLPNQDDILFTGEASVASGKTVLATESQHLSCFTGGMFGLGGKIFNITKHLDIGEKLTRGCAWAYSMFPTGIMPELFSLVKCPTLEACPWDEELWGSQASSRNLPKGFRNARDPRYLLRPEAVESVFLMYRMTGNEEFQEMAWRMFQSIVNATETPLAFSAISSVTTTGETIKLDSMESFWTAETLKYLYLTFSSPDLINLDEYVLNTEAHPLLRPGIRR